MKELRKHAEKNKLSIAQVIMANEMAVSGKTEEQINAFLDKIIGAMLATVKSGLEAPESDAARPDQAALQGSDVYKRAHGRQVRGDRGHRRRLGLRAGGVRGERPRPPGHHRADGRLGRRHAGHRLRPGRGQAQAAAGEDPRGPAGGGGHRLPVQAQRHALRGRGRLPGRDRRRLGHVGRVHRAGSGQLAPGGRERRRVGAASTTSA